MSTKVFESLRIKAGNMDDTFLNDPKSITGQFSSSTAYAAGDYVFYNKKLYRFTAAHAAGAWSGSDASEVTVSGELTAIKADLMKTGEQIYSQNKYNPNESEIGLLGESGNVYSGNTSYRTSGFIPVVGGDVVYLTAVKSDGTYVYAAGVIAAICWYDAEKTLVGRATNTNDYKINADNAAYIRVSFSITGSFGTARVVSITLNKKPLTAKEIRRWFDPYRIVNSIPLNVNVIDCWGDSRTEMVAAQGTSFCDYLNTLLGSAYQVTNYGISSEASGMCAARLGSNEIFVTLENNRINASGATNITEIYVTSGLINNYFCFSTAGGMPCTLNGIRGKIYKTIYNNYTSCAFVRDVDGSQVSVYPRTKVSIENESSKNHACIFWWGKNDMLTAAEGREGIKDIYNKAVEWLGHDRFIILGETCSLNETYYGTGKTLKVWVDDFNAYMMRKYPNNFIDINAWLSSETALTSVGLTPTDADLENIEKGWPCDSLMVHSTDASDEVHPNQKGREAIANRIYDWMVEHNWVL